MMSNGIMTYRVAIRLFNFYGKFCSRPKNKFAVLFLAFLNLCLFSKCLLSVVLNCSLLIASYVLTNFYKNVTDKISLHHTQ